MNTEDHSESQKDDHTNKDPKLDEKIMQFETINTDWSDRFNKIVLGIFRALFLVVWGLFSLVFYIPVMCLMFAYVFGMIFINYFQKIDLNAAQERLWFITNFYPNGFKQIQEMFDSEHSNENLASKEFEPIDLKDFIKKTWLYFAWTFIFWGLISIKIISVAFGLFLIISIVFYASHLKHNKAKQAKKESGDDQQRKAEKE